MKLYNTVLLSSMMIMLVGVSFAQEMTKDEWQREVTRYTQLRNEQQAKLQQVNNDIKALQGQTSKADGDITKCMDELYALVGSNAQQAAAYRSEIEAAERNADDLTRLSDADLVARSADVAALEAKVKSLRENKLSLIPEFSTRLDALDQKVASLKNALASAAPTAGEYTVSRGESLWRIAHKSDIYDNGRLWPKIWLDNKMIKNPDVIRPGQKLSIPPPGNLTPEERSARNRYYMNKPGESQ